jgi:hypothetical protein
MTQIFAYIPLSKVMWLMMWQWSIPTASQEN